MSAKAPIKTHAVGFDIENAGCAIAHALDGVCIWDQGLQREPFVDDQRVLLIALIEIPERSLRCGGSCCASVESAATRSVMLSASWCAWPQERSRAVRAWRRADRGKYCNARLPALRHLDCKGRERPCRMSLNALGASDQHAASRHLRRFRIGISDLCARLRRRFCAINANSGVRRREEERRQPRDIRDPSIQLLDICTNRVAGCRLPRVNGSCVRQLNRRGWSATSFTGAENPDRRAPIAVRSA